MIDLVNLTRRADGGKVISQLGKRPAVGIGNLSVNLRRLIAAPTFDAALLMVRRMEAASAAPFSLGFDGISNFVRLATSEIGNSGGRLMPNLRRSLMVAKQQPTLRDTLNDLDMAISHLSGVFSALMLIHEDMGMEAAGPVSDAFWALVSGGESFVRDGKECCQTLHQKINGVGYEH
jgi:hypothetical protein